MIRQIARSASRSSGPRVFGQSLQTPKNIPLVLPSRRAYSSFSRSTHPLAPAKQLPSSRFYPSIQRRSISTNPLPTTKSRFIRFAYRSFAYLGVTIVVFTGSVIAFFIYDASTYHAATDGGDVPVSEVALNPRRGGPKNLPIAEHLVDDDCAEMREQKHKPKLVILGTGWGSVALLKDLNPNEYHVTVVSPSNYFLFTPMLPSATVGTLELRSLVEPVRGIVKKVNGHFFKAKAEDVDFSAKLVEVSAESPNGQREHFYLPYDKLVIGVGSYSIAAK